MRTPFNRTTPTQRRVFRDGHWIELASDPVNGRVTLALARAALGVDAAPSRPIHTLASVRAVFGF